MVIKQKVANFAQMISIIDHIEFLMRCHDCVVIPNWGALIAHYKTAQFNDLGGAVSRPNRTIAFNPSIGHNDGLLANSLVRRHNIPYNQAVKLIDDCVTLFKQQLRDGSEVSFGRIGFFTLNKDRNIEFTPFVLTNSNDEFFGLKSFVFKRLHASYATVSSAEKHEPLTANEKPSSTLTHPISNNRFTHRILQVAASIAIILGIVFVASTPIAVDHSQQNLATMNIPVVKKPTATQSASFVPTTQSTQEQGATNSPTATKQALSDGKYYLVISTFSSLKKAQQYIQSHPEIQDVAQIWQKGKQYRIYTKRSNDYAALYHEATQLPSGWVTSE